MPERQGGRVPTVHVMIDSDDDIRFSAAVWRRCRLGSGRLDVSPPPSAYSKTTLMLHIVEALRPALPPGPWKYLDAQEPLGQLEMFPRDGSWGRRLLVRRQQPEQLAFFPDLEPPPPRGGVCLAEISDVAGVLRRVRIRELWILRAQALPADRWRDLVWLSAHADVGLYLVVHGRGATAAQLDRLRRCHVVYPRPPKLHGSAATPWWSRPPYRAGTAAPAALLKRLAQPRRRDPRVAVVPARPAPPAAALSGAELFERFRIAAAELVQDDEARSFVVLEAQALPAAPERISPERLAAALQAVARRGLERDQLTSVPPSGLPRSSSASRGP